MKKNTEKDIILLKKIKQSDKKSFEELFNKYYQNLCEYSFFIIKNKSCAEEVVADVFANIWIKRKKIKIKIRLKSYLFQSTKNMTISYIRKNKIKLESYSDEIYETIKSQNYADNEIIKLETKLKLERVLSILPKRNREIFVLHRISGFKYEEISTLLNISVKTVEKHMSKSLKLLKTSYSKN